MQIFLSFTRVCVLAIGSEPKSMFPKVYHQQARASPLPHRTNHQDHQEAGVLCKAQ